MYDPINYILGNRTQQTATLHILTPTIQDTISLILSYSSVHLHFSLNKEQFIATASSCKVSTDNKVMGGFRNVDMNTQKHNLLRFIIYNFIQCRQDDFVSIQQTLFICSLYVHRYIYSTFIDRLRTKQQAS